MPTPTEWSAIAAIAAACATLVSAIGLGISIRHQRAESQRHRLSQSIELLLRLEDRFNSETFRREREIAARGVMQGDSSALDPVLDYFETLGLLLERNSLDEEMIWSSFSSLYFSYMQVAEQYVAQTQNGDPTLWFYLTKLNDRMKSVREKLTGKRYPQLTEDEQKSFLRSESNLDTTRPTIDLMKFT